MVEMLEQLLLAEGRMTRALPAQVQRGQEAQVERRKLELGRA